MTGEDLKREKHRVEAVALLDGGCGLCYVAQKKIRKYCCLNCLQTIWSLGMKLRYIYICVVNE